MQSLGKWALCVYVWLLQKLSMKRLGPQSKTFLLIVLLSISPSKIFQKGLYFSTTSSFSWSSITSGSMTITKVFCTRERFWNRLFYINGFRCGHEWGRVYFGHSVRSYGLSSNSGSFDSKSNVPIPLGVKNLWFQEHGHWAWIHQERGMAWPSLVTDRPTLPGWPPLTPPPFPRPCHWVWYGSLVPLSAPADAASFW